METIELVKSGSCDSIQDFEAIEEAKLEMRSDYFRLIDKNEYEIVPVDIPKSEHTRLSLLNSFYNTLCLAAKIPEFSETANGIIELFIQGTVTRCTYENIMIAIASAISLNPAFAWWLMVNGGVVAANVIVLVLEFSVMNPTKMVMLYGLSRKLPLLMKLYNYIYEK